MEEQVDTPTALLVAFSAAAVVAVVARRAEETSEEQLAAVLGTKPVAGLPVQFEMVAAEVAVVALLAVSPFATNLQPSCNSKQTARDCPGFDHPTTQQGCSHFPRQ